MRIVITDTGCANIASVRYAVERLGYQPLVTADPDLIRQADKVFLPGVGTAGAAMENLTARGLASTISSLTQPVLARPRAVRFSIAAPAVPTPGRKTLSA